LNVPNWRFAFLDRLQAEIARRFPSAVVELERNDDGAGNYALQATWRANGLGAWVHMPVNTPAGHVSFEQALEHVTNTLWDMAPIAGNA
jgi:hypothetical protein